MTKEALLKVPAIHCSSCANTISSHVNALDGVSAVEVDAESKEVRLTFDESSVTLGRIRDSLEEIGFFAED